MKERGIDPYTLRLIRENLFYFFSLIISILVLVYVFNYQIRDFFSYQKKISDINQELTELQTKREIVYSYKPEELDVLIKTINALLPQQEDYFSIMSAIENISSRTGFRVLSYAVRFSQASRDKVTLEVEGYGTPDALIQFLQNYQYQGGRLITMDEIEFAPQSQKTSFTLNFYAKEAKISSSGPLKIDKKIIDLVKKISGELSLSTTASTLEGQIEEIYSPKQNPFGL